VAKHLARMGDRCVKMCGRKVKQREQLENLGTDGRMGLSCNLRNWMRQINVDRICEAQNREERWQFDDMLTTVFQNICHVFTVSTHVRHLLGVQTVKVSFLKLKFIHRSNQPEQTENSISPYRINSHTQDTTVLQRSIFLTRIRPLLVIQNQRSSNSPCSHCTVRILKGNLLRDVTHY
jgi:hypothetical protein